MSINFVVNDDVFAIEYITDVIKVQVGSMTYDGNVRRSLGELFQILADRKESDVLFEQSLYVTIQNLPDDNITVEFHSRDNFHMVVIIKSIKRKDFMRQLKDIYQKGTKYLEENPSGLGPYNPDGYHFGL